MPNTYFIHQQENPGPYVVRKIERVLTREGNENCLKNLFPDDPVEFSGNWTACFEYAIKTGEENDVFPCVTNLTGTVGEAKKDYIEFAKTRGITIDLNKKDNPPQKDQYEDISSFLLMWCQLEGLDPACFREPRTALYLKERDGVDTHRSINIYKYGTPALQRKWNDARTQLEFFSLVGG